MPFKTCLNLFILLANLMICQKVVSVAWDRQVDALGQITTFTFDDNNNQLSKTDPLNRNSTATYNDQDDQLTQTDPLGDRVAFNRLDTVTDTEGNQTTYTYDSVGNRISVTHSNANVTSYVYDELNRLTQLQDKKSDNSIYQQFDYTLHSTGRRLKIEELNGRVSDYTYDNLYRLTDETITDPVNGNYTARYGFDKVGNRITSTINGVTTNYTIDNNDRLTQEGGEVYTYDNNGSTLSKTIDSDITTYTYDPKQRLIAAEILESGVTKTNNYRYNVE